MIQKDQVEFKIDRIPYKITYEGIYEDKCFELEIFDKDYNVVWLEPVYFENISEIEKEIYDRFNTK